MTKTPTERARDYRARKKLKGLDVTEETLEALRTYQQEQGLPNRSVAILDAIRRAGA